MELPIFFQAWLFVSFIVVIVFVVFFFKSIKIFLINIDSDIISQINNEKKLLAAYSVSKKTFLLSLGWFLFSYSLLSLIQFVLYSSSRYSDKEICSQILFFLHFGNLLFTLIFICSFYSLILIFIFGKWNNKKLAVLRWSAIVFACYILFRFSIRDLIDFVKTPIKDLPDGFFVVVLGLFIFVVLTRYYIKIIFKSDTPIIDIENQEET
ncbi:hypothetical protein ACSAZK_03815 [Methanosarcina sp. Mfa9]|uniref:hypothetical protein n=1 Tax=Methanosarcina sp. Mfa9 TaxID=3439063 RepID=UPI003F84A87A